MIRTRIPLVCIIALLAGCGVARGLSSGADAMPPVGDDRQLKADESNLTRRPLILESASPDVTREVVSQQVHAYLVNSEIKTIEMQMKTVADGDKIFHGRNATLQPTSPVWIVKVEGSLALPYGDTSPSGPGTASSSTPRAESMTLEVSAADGRVLRSLFPIDRQGPPPAPRPARF